ncbi:MAG: hypothetical protein ABUL48_02950 [Pseudorhodoplanes sp.]
MNTGTIRKRSFLCIGGYEPVDAAWWHRRFVRELKRFETTWNAKAAASEPVGAEDKTVARWTIEAEGANWKTETDYRLLCWDDFVTADFHRSDTVRVPRGIVALADFILSGTAFRYFRTSVRYGFFFLYPVLILILMATLAGFIPNLLGRFGVMLPLWAAILVSIAVFIGLLYVPGRFLLLNYMFDDWIFASELAHHNRKGLDERLDRFARELVKCARDRSCDEVVLSAHSLGGALAMSVIDRALKLDPDLGARGPALWLMTTGSSLLKVALHPKAEWIREATAHVADAKNLNWIEYHAVVDVISFFKTDPVVEMGLAPRGKPIVQTVRMRNMLAPETYKRFWGNFFRLHRQWSMGNELRYFYDYFQICCGPVPLARRVAAGDRLKNDFATDGAYAAALAMPDKAAVGGQG